LSGGSSNQFVLTQAKPSSLAALFIGMTQINAPFKGGTMQPYRCGVHDRCRWRADLPSTFPAGLPWAS
jgi:hypothetical protein